MIKNLIKDTIRIDLNKNAKPPYYIKNIIKMFVPKKYYKNLLKKLITTINDTKYVFKRVNYYNKMNSSFQISNRLYSIKEFSKKEKMTTYYFDLIEHLRYFNESLAVSYKFGDITEIPDEPSFVKSRPIADNNQHSLLINLDKVRHFIFLNDTTQFIDKKDMLCWRGKAHQPHRRFFLEKFYTHPLCDVGQIIKNRDKSKDSIQWVKDKLSIKEQLKYKFILAIEGNDVASNLKWAMSSNSLVFMTKPKYETWFMEGTLLPNYHYVLLEDDYSDLEEKINFYSKNSAEALKIIENAHDYIKQFKNTKREKIISLLVIKKYFELSNQC